ncbi:MAG TPA: hypothetical protein VKR22_08650 [Acidimicrobiales bacterium]|nr:hypothetical protein [Acidimicrobiales bacterium]
MARQDDAVTSTPLARKMGIRPGDTVALIGAPKGFSVPELPDGARLRRGGSAPADIRVVFVRQADELIRVGDVVPQMRKTDALWVAWPRRAAGHTSDVTDNMVRGAGLDAGVVDVKVAALGEDWSGIRFVFRLADR